MMGRFLIAAALTLLGAAAQAQSTGASFPTPNGQIAPGSAILVPCGSIVNGQPVVCPPGQANGLQVVCTNCSPSAPIGAPSNPTNGTISSTGVFQVLLAQNPSRKGCVYQNQGTHPMDFSISATPAHSNSLTVYPGWVYYCSGRSNVTITDTIYITGTAGDAFSGEWQ
jgi:hypothetical protein